MYMQFLDMDEHATLWPALDVKARFVKGPEDMTVGMHPSLGLCLVRHYGFESRVEWSTCEPIPDALLR
ncbi:hypothetical protein [Methylobacterium sp. SD274]|uniref:hypothetical protein n=1 Tax=Methylobacterium sp. SD274 TaxID=2782009 RepID=UPI001FED5963|nr:hypothetical protein [Methylobacterium sp. SD274]